MFDRYDKVYERPYKICPEKSKLNKHHLQIAQRKGLPEEGDKDIVHAGNKTPHEKEDRDDNKSGAIITGSHHTTLTKALYTVLKNE